MSGGELTKAQKALARVFAFGGPQLTLRQAAVQRLTDDLRICRRAGYYEHAGYETSLKAESWLASEAGKAALDAALSLANGESK